MTFPIVIIIIVIMKKGESIREKRNFTNEFIFLKTRFFFPLGYFVATACGHSFTITLNDARDVSHQMLPIIDSELIVTTDDCLSAFSHSLFRGEKIKLRKRSKRFFK